MGIRPYFPDQTLWRWAVEGSPNIGVNASTSLIQWQFCQPGTHWMKIPFLLLFVFWELSDPTWTVEIVYYLVWIRMGLVYCGKKNLAAAVAVWAGSIGRTRSKSPLYIMQQQVIMAVAVDSAFIHNQPWAEMSSLALFGMPSWKP